MTDFIEEQKEYVAANFDNLVLPNQIIETTLFEECFFHNCELSETTFMDCEFIDCHFSQCNLSVIKINECRFSDVVFEECKIVGVDWTEANWPSILPFSPIKFTKCILNDSTFVGLHLNEIAIEECSARNVDFRRGRFCDASFAETDLANSFFNETDLSGSDFTEAVNYRIDINHNRIKGATFSRSEAVRLLECLDIELVD
jgi:uncharacterized protein YjbI with pentapeptide repeats